MPTGRSRIQITEVPPALRTIRGKSSARTLFAGITERGPLRTPKLVLDWAGYVKLYGAHRASADLAIAVQGHFAEGGGPCYVSRVTHYTDITDPLTSAAVKATKTLLTAVLTTASAGKVTSSKTQNFALAPGDTLQVHVDEDAGGPDTATFNATAPSVDSGAGPFNLDGNTILTLAVNGGVAQSYTFVDGDSAGATLSNITVAEVIDVINREFIGVQAFLNAGNCRVATDRQGTSATIDAGGAARAILGFLDPVQTGTGNVADISAVTGAEIKTIVEAAMVPGVLVTTAAGLVTIASLTTGAGSSIMVEVASTADDEIGFDNVLHSGSATSPAVNTLKVDGKTEGAWGNNLTVDIEAATSGVALEFNLVVKQSSVVRETWTNLSMDDTDTVKFVEVVINDSGKGSDYITVTDQDAGGTPTTDRPVNIAASALATGNDGISAIADTDYVGDSAGGTGLRAFDTVTDGTILAVPARSSLLAVSNAIKTYCETTRNGSLFGIIDPAAGKTAATAATDFDTRGLGSTEFVATYWPRVKILNPDKVAYGTARDLTVPPSGMLSGLFGRNDANPGGVYEPPAGEEKWGQLLTPVGLETDEVQKDAARDVVFDKRINPITKTPGGVIYVDGARVGKGTSNFPGVAERRGAIFIKTTIQAGLAFAKHRNNNAKLQQEVGRTVTAFLLGEFRKGAFRGATPADSFFVNFGPDQNPPSQVFLNVLHGEIGIATNKAAEFITIDFNQDTRDIEAELADL